MLGFGFGACDKELKDLMACDTSLNTCVCLSVRRTKIDGFVGRERLVVWRMEIEVVVVVSYSCMRVGTYSACMV